MTVAEAEKMLRTEYGPGKYFSISMFVYSHDSNRVNAEWTVWDQVKNHSAATLEKAVESALFGHRSTPADLDEIDRSVASFGSPY